MWLIEAIRSVFRFIRNLVRAIVQGVLNFFRHIVGWFRGLMLNPNRDVPFVADANAIKDMLKTAPTKKVGIFEGVYNEAENEITHHRFIEADKVDKETQKNLGKNDIVILN